jgi:flagellar protein FliO/FliZ
MRVAPHRAYRQFVRSCLLLNATARSCAARRVLYAISATPFAAPVQQVASGSAGGLLRVVVALIVVLAAVLAAAWLARRMRAFSGGGGGANLEMLAQLPLGTRERVVLLRVGDCQVLIGVAPGSVRTLHVLQAPSLPAADAATAHADAVQASDAVARPTFKALLLRSLGK